MMRTNGLSLGNTVNHAHDSLLSNLDYISFARLRGSNPGLMTDCSVSKWLSGRSFAALIGDASDITRSSDFEAVLAYCQENLSYDEQREVLSEFFDKVITRSQDAARLILDTGVELKPFPVIKAVGLVIKNNDLGMLRTILSSNSANTSVQEALKSWLPSYSMCDSTELFKTVLDCVVLDQRLLEICLMNSVHTPYLETVRLLLTHPNNAGRIPLNLDFLAEQARRSGRTDIAELIASLA